MNSVSIDIWKPATGIADIEVDPKELAASEIPGIRAVWEDRRKRLHGTEQLAAFSEKMAREWAIETGVIEDVYDIDRGVTETLIEHGLQLELLTHGSTDKPRGFVLQIIRDQKDALDGVFDFVKSQRKLSVSYIKELHSALLRSQQVTEAVDALGNTMKVSLLKGEWKKQPNSPRRDGKMYLYCPPEQVASEMDRLMGWHDEHLTSGVSPEVEAAWLHHRFSQIHPFQDGNGRVARALASLILVKGGLFPLVVTRDDRQTYIAALEAGDAGDLKPLVELVARLQRAQFTKAIAVSETVLAEGADIGEALDGLRKAADKAAVGQPQAHKDVFAWANELEADVENALKRIAPVVKDAVLKVNSTGNAYVTRSGYGTEHNYRAQIVENAKSNLRYLADMSEYRSWIALNVIWDRRARLVFAFHGIGKPFSGSLICAPFLLLMDIDDDGRTSQTLVPVADEGFVFFYTDIRDQLLARFGPWRDQVFKAALKELAESL